MKKFILVSPRTTGIDDSVFLLFVEKYLLFHYRCKLRLNLRGHDSFAYFSHRVIDRTEVCSSIFSDYGSITDIRYRYYFRPERSDNDPIYYIRDLNRVDEFFFAIHPDDLYDLISVFNYKLNQLPW